MRTTRRLLIDRLEARTLLSTAMLGAMAGHAPAQDAAEVVSQPRILFVRGADRSGGFLEARNDSQRTSQLADINTQSTANGNHGWFELAQALRGAGYLVEQRAEPLERNAPATGQTTGAALDLRQLDLAAYAVVVMGSNNAVYTTQQIDALEQYVRNGGAVLFISDANFGSNWADAPDSDQQFLARFGLTVNQDQGTYALTRAAGDFLRPEHPIFAGVDSFDGEGVSPLFIANASVPGVTAVQLARARNNTRPNAAPFGANQQGSSRPVNAADSSLLVANVDNGRIAGHFDRNTFFNANGAGTNINRLHNRRFALNLFAWLATDATPPQARSVDLDLNQRPQVLRVQFSEDVSASLTGTDVSVVRTGTPQPLPLTYDGWDAATRTARFRFARPLENGNLDIRLRAADVADRAGNTLAGNARFDSFFMLGDLNRDRRVNIDDKVVLTRNLGQSNRTYLQGDLSHDGRVNFADLLILSRVYDTSLPAARDEEKKDAPDAVLK